MTLNAGAVHGGNKLRNAQVFPARYGLPVQDRLAVHSQITLQTPLL